MWAAIMNQREVDSELDQHEVGSRAEFERQPEVDPQILAGWAAIIRRRG